MIAEKGLSTVEKVLFLKSINLFEHMVIEELGHLSMLTEWVRFETGTVILREGEPVDAIYLILRGWVTVERNGRRIREVGDKEALGTVAALDRDPAVFTVKATEPVDALKLNTADFHEILSQDYELVRAVFRALCRLIRADEAKPRT